MRRPRVTVVGAIDRPDILRMFTGARDQADLAFIEYRYNWGIPTHPERYQPYGPVGFWDSYAHADALLDHLRPDRLGFFYISSFNQIVLKLAAQRRGIRTLHLEHGHRVQHDAHDYSAGFRREHSRRFDRRKIAREYSTILANQAFFLRSLLRGPLGEARVLGGFALQSYLHGATTESLAQIGRLRQPDVYLAFSPETFHFHQVQDNVEFAENRVHFTGIPYFDFLSALPPLDIDESRVLLIDHQFHNGGLFGWDLEFRRRWAESLHRTIVASGRRLTVKLHPGDVSDVWLPYLGRGVDIATDSDIRETVAKTRIVLGTFSTMQLPIAAMPHTLVMSLEIHPEEGHFPSAGLVNAGVAEPIRTFAELETALASLDGIAQSQSLNKSAFLHQFLFRMDGCATERFTRALLDG